MSSRHNSLGRAAISRAIAGSRQFARRHRFAWLTLWLHIPVITVLGWSAGIAPGVVGAASLILVAMALAGTLLHSPVLASYVTASGLVFASVIVNVSLSGVVIGSLHLIAVIVVVSVYRDRRPLLLAVIAGAASLLIYSQTFETGQPREALLTSIAVSLIALVLASTWRYDGRFDRGRDLSSLYRLGFTHAPVGMAMAKPSGEFLAVNQTLGRIIDREPDEMIGATVRSMIHPDDMANLGDAWEAMATGDDHSSTAWVRCMVQGDGSIWVQLSLVLVPWEPDQSAVVLLRIEDMSEPKTADTDLESLMDGRDDFVAAVGNELRAPLGLMVDLSNDGDPKMRAIAAHAREAASIVDDLIASARPTSSAEKFNPTLIDTEALCRNVTGAVPGAENITIDIRSAELWADESTTHQILFGLVHHAVRFGGSRVRLETLASGPDTLVQVIDDGPAVPHDERERIFNADMRHGRPITEPASVGMSLTVGRRLARSMDGDIAYRRSVDGENVFELRLPATEVRPLLAQRRRGQIGTAARI